MIADASTLCFLASALCPRIDLPVRAVGSIITLQLVPTSQSRWWPCMAPWTLNPRDLRQLSWMEDWPNTSRTEREGMCVSGAVVSHGHDETCGAAAFALGVEGLDREGREMARKPRKGFACFVSFGGFRDPKCPAEAEAQLA